MATEDKKNPKEASNIFHSIMKASVKGQTTSKKEPSVERNSFSKEQASEIRSILSTLHTLPRDEQKKVRADLRSRLKFYISDYTNSKTGFNAEDFDNCVKQGLIEIK